MFAMQNLTTSKTVSNIVTGFENLSRQYINFNFLSPSSISSVQSSRVQLCRVQLCRVQGSRVQESRVQVSRRPESKRPDRTFRVQLAYQKSLDLDPGSLKAWTMEAGDMDDWTLGRLEALSESIYLTNTYVLYLNSEFQKLQMPRLVQLSQPIYSQDTSLAEILLSLGQILFMKSKTF